MRSAIAVLALGLLVLAATSAGIEAMAGCLEGCADEASGQDQCSNDACCSCCVHAGPLFASLRQPPPILAPAGHASALKPPGVPPGRPSEILHVPKSSPA